MLLPTSELLTSQDFALEKGGVLPRLDIAYETWGTLNAAGDNGVLICHGYTNNQHAANTGEGDDTGWFAGVIGPGRAVDTDRYFVVAANMLGSAYGSTGPASIDPATGQPYGLKFPDITIGDMVNAQIRLLDHLGVQQMAAVIGNSFGGYLTFHWGTEHPERMRALVPVVSAIRGRGDPASVDALIERFRAACPGWNDGQYYGAEQASGVFEEMLKLRMETLSNYGYKTGVRELAEPWAQQFDANSLIVLRRTTVQFDASLKADNIKAPVLYVLSRTDNLFPPSIAPDTMKLLADAGVDAQYFEINSDNGHRAPSIDGHLWADALAAFMDRTAKT
jgi:homoserine O-acetyltransferase/O-succinyltransferase